MVEIREVTKDDTQALKEFFLSLSDNAVFNFNHFGKVNEEFLAEHMATNLCASPIHERSWVATEDKGIIGYGFLHFPDKPTQKFTCSLGIVVADAYQHKGVGRELVAYMIASARSLRMRKIWLQVYERNVSATTLYSNLGFRVEGIFNYQEWDEDKPLTVLSMGKLLI